MFLAALCNQHQCTPFLHFENVGKIILIMAESQGAAKYAEGITKHAICLKQGQVSKGEPSIFEIPLHENTVASGSKFRSFTFGEESGTGIVSKHKVIMVVGATGAGKSTLINGMINYILKVDWKDGFRFKLVTEKEMGSQAHSQTQIITAYTIKGNKHHRVDYTLTIIDTPGFGDTRGIAQDQKIIEQIREFFSVKSHPVDHIDAIGFVAQASQARLTHTQRYVFDSILSVFGNDMGTNILLLVTFADGQKPPVINAVDEAKIPRNRILLKFNNSALFASTKTTADEEDSTDDEADPSNFDEMFWKMGNKSMKKFFDTLDKLEPKSLRLTKEVLEERKRLETAVEGLQPQIKVGMLKLEELRIEKKTLEQHKADITANKDFEFYIDVPKCRKEDIPNGSYITNCLKCNYTCHYPCIYSNDSDKYYCGAMDSGYCVVCPNKCVWNVHYNMRYKFEYYTDREKRTSAEIKQRYMDASGKKLTGEQIIQRQEQEIHEVKIVVYQLITQSQQSINRLEEIALKANPLSTVEYIDLMIDAEKRENKEGWQSRVQGLQDVRKQADIMKKVQTENFDPFAQYNEGDNTENKPKKGFFSWFKS